MWEDHDEGQPAWGAAANGVVNYPWDNRQFDRDGARSLRLAVLIFDEAGGREQ